MGNAIRAILGVVIGFITACFLLASVEYFSSIVHPFPEDFDGSKEEVVQHVARYPHWVLAVMVPMWGLIAWVSPWIAKRIGGRIAASVIGILLVVGVVFNVSILPYPIWFKIVIVVAVLIAAAFGIGKSTRYRVEEKPASELAGH